MDLLEFLLPLFFTLVSSATISIALLHCCCVSSKRPDAKPGVFQTNPTATTEGSDERQEEEENSDPEMGITPAVNYDDFQSKSKTPKKAKTPNDMYGVNKEELKISGNKIKCKPSRPADPPLKYKPANDPQYKTLAGIDNEVFDDKNKKGSSDDKLKYKAANDPIYKTLAGIDNEIFDNKGAGGADPKKHKFKPTHDPAYQTLAGMDNKIFDTGGQQPKNARDGKFKPANDPQYHTLAGLQNQIFDKQK